MAPIISKPGPTPEYRWLPPIEITAVLFSKDSSAALAISEVCDDVLLKRLRPERDLRSINITSPLQHVLTAVAHGCWDAHEWAQQMQSIGSGDDPGIVQLDEYIELARLLLNTANKFMSLPAPKAYGRERITPANAVDRPSMIGADQEIRAVKQVLSGLVTLGGINLVQNIIDKGVSSKASFGQPGNPKSGDVRLFVARMAAAWLHLTGERPRPKMTNFHDLLNEGFKAACPDTPPRRYPKWSSAIESVASDDAAPHNRWNPEFRHTYQTLREVSPEELRARHLVEPTREQHIIAYINATTDEDRIAAAAALWLRHRIDVRSADAQREIEGVRAQMAAHGRPN